MIRDLDFWRSLTIVVAAIGQTFFVLLYTTFPWWRSFLGRALFYEALTFALLVDTAVAVRVWDLWNEDAIIVALYGLVATGVWWRLMAFVRIKLRGNNDERDG